MAYEIASQNGRLKIFDRPEPRPVVNIEGQQVALGPLSRDLLPTYRRWFNDFATLTLIDRRFQPRSAEWIETWYERQSKGDPSCQVFTVWQRDSWRPLGTAALQEIDLRNRTAEMGLLIGEPECRGRGFGTEATRLLLDLAFRVLGLQSVMLRVYEYNLAARRCYERAGFKEFGRRHQAQFMGGRFWDVIYMECLAGDLTEPPPTLIFSIDNPV
jgi:RimJ/RimL family protein N-acetyltransferase